MYMDWENWVDYFRLSFTRAVDGALMDLKLGVNEINAVATLTGDSLHHCVDLILEASL